MTYDFDTVIDRRGTLSVKWDFAHKYLAADECAADPLPMWVADMDFRSPPPVLQALHRAVDHGIFGYSNSLKPYNDAIVGWQRKRFGWEVDPEWIVKTPGVVAALAYIVQTFSAPGDAILVQSPVYGPFSNVPSTNGRRVVSAPLREQDDHYVFDAHHFEDVVKTHRPAIFILCNPHNPTGNVWSRPDLQAMSRICQEHDILVVADEIHQDLIFNRSVRHVPFASLDDDSARISITCTAPSKTFNLAGLQVSNLFVPDAKKREQLQRHMDRCGAHLVNQLGMVACQAAYTEGEPWLEALLDYVAANHTFLASELQKSLPRIQVFRTDALYLAWLDCRKLDIAPEHLQHHLLTRGRIWFDSGQKFGDSGKGFLRVNLGCPRATLEEGLMRLRSAMS